MKSIYSLPVLQRILDKYGVGKIIYTTYFDNIGRMTWRHFIETTQGKFELYSFPKELHEYALERIKTSAAGGQGILNPKLTHSFDRYHLLKQLSRKIKITPKQLATDLELLKAAKITKTFRVHGSILQIQFNTQAIVSCYGRWSLQHTVHGKPTRVLTMTQMHGPEKLDAALSVLANKPLEFSHYILKGYAFELYFSEGYSFHFLSYEQFSAAKLNFPNRKNIIHVFDERNIQYVKEL